MQLRVTHCGVCYFRPPRTTVYAYGVYAGQCTHGSGFTVYYLSLHISQGDGNCNTYKIPSILLLPSSRALVFNILQCLALYECSTRKYDIDKPRMTISPGPGSLILYSKPPNDVMLACTSLYGKVHDYIQKNRIILLVQPRILIFFFS